MRESVAHFTIIVHNTDSQALKFLLKTQGVKSLLDKVMGIFGSSLTIKPVMFMKTVGLSTGIQNAMETKPWDV